MAAQAGIYGYIGLVPFQIAAMVHPMLASPSMLLQHDMMLHCELTSALKIFQTSLPVGSLASVWGRLWRFLVTMGSSCHHGSVMVPRATV